MCAIRGTLMLLVLPLVAVGSQAPTLPNPDFEGDEAGKPPKTWQLTPRTHQQGFRAQVSDQKPRQGKRCLELISTSLMPTFGVYGLVVQSLPAEALRGCSAHCPSPGPGARPNIPGGS